jgi:hypothetical protein
MRALTPMIRVTKNDKNQPFADNIEFINATDLDTFMNKCFQALQALIQSNCDITIITGAFY